MELVEALGPQRALYAQAFCKIRGPDSVCSRALGLHESTAERDP